MDWFEMKGWAALMLVVGLAAACASPGPAPQAVTTPTPVPPSAIPVLTASAAATRTEAPSPGCGFTLVITNKASSPVTVAINDQAVGTIEPEDEMLQPQGHVPLMPWDVVVSRASDGTELASRHYEWSTEMAYLTVTDLTATTMSNWC